MGKFALIVKTSVVIAGLLMVKLLVHFLGWDTVGASPVITALVAGVIFTIAIIFTGTLSDFKESEKIPGELAGSFKSILRDTRIPNLKDDRLLQDTRDHIKSLLKTILASFRNNSWDQKAISAAIDQLDDDIYRIGEEGAAAPLLVKLRAELANIDKTANRIQVITETSFIAAAYHIAIIATSAVILVLLFTTMNPYYEGLLLFAATAFVLVSLLLLIKDMDNPFEVGKNSSADVDLSILFRLEEYVKTK